MKARLRASDLKKIVSNTKRFTANCTNKLMQYIYLEVDAEAMQIKATACDGYRIAVEYAGLVEADESFRCFIKPSIPKIAKNDLYAELELIDGKAFVMVNENIMGYVQPEGKYIKVGKILEDLEDEKPAASVYVDANLLKQALEITGLGLRSCVKIELRNPKAPIVIKPPQKGSKDIRVVLPIRGPED